VSKLFTQNCYLLSWRIEPGRFSASVFLIILALVKQFKAKI